MRKIAQIFVCFSESPNFIFHKNLKWISSKTCSDCKKVPHSAVECWTVQAQFACTYQWVCSSSFYFCIHAPPRTNWLLSWYEMREKESEEVFLSMFRALLLLGFPTVVMFLLLIYKMPCCARRQISTVYSESEFFLARRVANHLTKSQCLIGKVQCTIFYRNFLLTTYHHASFHFAIVINFQRKRKWVLNDVKLTFDQRLSR